MSRINYFMGRAIIYPIDNFSGYFSNFFTCLLYRAISTFLGRNDNMKAFQRFLTTLFSRILRVFGRRSIFRVLFTRADVDTDITCKANKGDLSRRYIIITVNDGNSCLRDISTNFAFRPSAIFHATRGYRFANDFYFFMDFFIRGTRRRCLIYIMILGSNKGRTTRFFGVWFRFLSSCCVILGSSMYGFLFFNVHF